MSILWACSCRRDFVLVAFLFSLCLSLFVHCIVRYFRHVLFVLPHMVVNNFVIRFVGLLVILTMAPVVRCVREGTLDFSEIGRR